jgi:hypothetical protein
MSEVVSTVSCPGCHADVPTAEAALREHVAFLRELLADKRGWYAEALGQARDANAELRREAERWRQECERLRVALAAAVQDMWGARWSLCQGGNWEFDDAQLEAWDKLTEVGP